MKTRTLTPEQQKIVVSHIDFAEKLAKPFRHCGIEMDDLKQESLYGLCHAAMHYNPKSNAEFTTIAYFWCRKFMMIAINEYGNPFGLPAEARDEQRLIRLDYAFANDDVNESDDDEASILDYLLYRLWLSDHAENDTPDFVARIDHYLKQLPSKQQAVIERLFGIGREKMSGKDTATALDISEARVAQLKAMAMQALKTMHISQ